MTHWPHAPTHQLTEAGAYMVTSGTYLKQHHFRDPWRAQYLHDHLLELAETFGWQLVAWAVFSNHYHFVGQSPADPTTLRPFLAKLHKVTADMVNAQDGTSGKKVWFNYWDKHLTFQPSYLTRLRYVHTNPVHHRLVRVATEYPWCSAAWFERTAPLSCQLTLASLKIDRIQVYDDFPL